MFQIISPTVFAHLMLVCRLHKKIVRRVLAVRTLCGSIND
jgi:hypothetical protein